MSEEKSTPQEEVKVEAVKVAEATPAAEEKPAEAKIDVAALPIEQHWKHFNSDPEEYIVDQKIVKAVNGMPANLQDRFKMLYINDNQRAVYGDKLDLEIEALEQKIRAKKRPVLEARNEIIKGKNTDFTEAVKKFDEAYISTVNFVNKIKRTAAEKADYDEQNKEHEVISVDHLKDEGDGIEDFWRKSVERNEMLMSIIRPNDMPAFEFLTEISCEVGNEKTETHKSSIKSTLHFAENEWFSNESLTIHAFFKDGEREEPLRFESTVIDWKNGKDLSKKKTKKKQKNKKTGETRTVTKTVDQESIFNVFKTFDAPEDDDDSDEEEQDEETKKMVEQTQECIQFAEDTMNIYQDGLLYYMGMGPTMAEMMAQAGYNPEDFAAGGDGQGSDDDDPDAGGEGFVPQSKFGSKKN